jgi:hypothetical protein
VSDEAGSALPEVAIHTKSESRSDVIRLAQRVSAGDEPGASRAGF